MYAQPINDQHLWSIVLHRSHAVGCFYAHSHALNYNTKSIFFHVFRAQCTPNKIFIYFIVAAVIIVIVFFWDCVHIVLYEYFVCTHLHTISIAFCERRACLYVWKACERVYLLSLQFSKFLAILKGNNKNYCFQQLEK